jgi:hypothetical protein
MTRPKSVDQIDQDETQKRPLRPESDQKETYSIPKGDLFATSELTYTSFLEAIDSIPEQGAGP